LAGKMSRTFSPHVEAGTCPLDVLDRDVATPAIPSAAAASQTARQIYEEPRSRPPKPWVYALAPPPAWRGELPLGPMWFVKVRQILGEAGLPSSLVPTPPDAGCQSVAASVPGPDTVVDGLIAAITTQLGSANEHGGPVETEAPGSARPDGSVHSAGAGDGAGDQHQVSATAVKPGYLGLIVDEGSRIVSRGACRQDFGGKVKPWRVLIMLMRNGTKYTSVEALRGIWATDRTAPEDTTIETTVSHLRKLLLPLRVAITNKYKLGYHFLRHPNHFPAIFPRDSSQTPARRGGLTCVRPTQRGSQMSIDLTTQKAISVSEIPKLRWLPHRANGRRLHVATVHRWCTRGVRGVRLPFVRVGGTRVTTEEALTDFFRVLAQQDAPAWSPASQRPTTTTQVEEELDRAGL
jgi:hypothetical protein